MKLATYFYSQAAEFASALGAPRSKAKILAKQLDLSSRLQCDTELEPLLEQLTAIASTVSDIMIRTRSRG